MQSPLDHATYLWQMNSEDSLTLNGSVQLAEYWLTYEQNFIKIGGISLLILASAVENGLSLPNLTCRFLRIGR